VRRYGDDAGFTLVEVMVALVVFAIGVLALSAVQTRSSDDVYSAGRRSRALELAQEQVETARAVGYDGAVSDSGLSGPLAWTSHVDSVDIDLKSVTVSVNWQEKGSPRSLQLQTLLSKR
jgi:type IV pilus assembly protein PilV